MASILEGKHRRQGLDVMMRKFMLEQKFPLLHGNVLKNLAVFLFGLFVVALLLRRLFPELLDVFLFVIIAAGVPFLLLKGFERMNGLLQKYGVIVMGIVFATGLLILLLTEVL